MPRALFLSFDGPDGTGKSTQCDLLVKRLRAAGLPTTLAVDPGGTELGGKLRELLLFGRQHQMTTRAEALLFMASRAELVERVIRPALERSEVVVADRYLLANVVYQGHAGGLDVSALWSVGAFATGGVAPDLSLVFDAPPEVAAPRRKPEADRVEARGAEYHARVRAGFLAEAARSPKPVRVIDATADIDDVAAIVRCLAREQLARHGWPVDTLTD